MNFWRVYWAIIGMLGASILGFCLGMHTFGFSARALFGSREAANTAQMIIVIVGWVGCLFLFYRPLRYALLDFAAIVVIGMFLGLLVSRAGYDMYDDLVAMTLVRGGVYTGGIAMIRAWWVSQSKEHPRPVCAF